MNASTIRNKFVLNEIDLDSPELSICPSCTSQVIKLVDGCDVCGWSEEDKLLGEVALPETSSGTRDDRGEKLSIPCTIQHPKQPQIKGVIQQDLGDRFVVYLPSQDNTVTVSKLLVYPDFSGVPQRYNIGQSDEILQGGLNICSSKVRRKKGEGSGHIYYRSVTRNGREYRQAYYQWREDGKQRTKYIPQKLLSIVEEAEQQKYPVAEILELLLGGLDKSSSKSSSTLSDEEVLAKDKSIETTDNCSSNSSSPPSKRKKRSSGYGGGYIEYREVKRNHKTYAQYWYHFEFWKEGDRVTKKSCYIPKRSLQKIERMNHEKLPVEEILKVLRNKSKKKK